MIDISDRDYVLNRQYQDASRLNTRIVFHERFNTNPYRWYRWLFDRLNVPSDARILEVGAGSGRWWLENADRIPAGWYITLSDLSPGMLEEARETLTGVPHHVEYVVADIEHLPFPDASFDTVVANYVLFHVPDVPRAIAEIRRVLAPAGRVYAATPSRDNMRELFAAMGRFDVDSPLAEPSRFNLESGGELLATQFAQVHRHVHEDALEVTEIEPLIAYIRSGRGRAAAEGENEAKFREWAREHIATSGAVHISKRAGVFECLCELPDGDDPFERLIGIFDGPSQVDHDDIYRDMQARESHDDTR